MPFQKSFGPQPQQLFPECYVSPKDGGISCIAVQILYASLLPISLSFFPNSDYTQQFLLKCFWSNYIRFLYPNKTLTDQILSNQSGTEKIIVYLDQLGFLYINKTYQIFDN